MGNQFFKQTGAAASSRGQAPAFASRSSAAQSKTQSLERQNSKAPVSRAENKIAGAAESFGYDFRGKTVLDIGSSTGGFTEYALLRGAQKVIAVEKGTNQMKAPLRFDSRIDLHEKTDIFNVYAYPASSGPRTKNVTQSNRVEIDTPDVILADVSFISLKPVLTHAKVHIANKNTDFLVMLKPQFEAEPKDLHKGVVKNEKIRREIVKNFESWLKENKFIIMGKRDNTLAGRTGNLERFYFLKIAK